MLECVSETWQRATMSKCSAKMSTSLPLPSSPHCEPNTPETWLSDAIRLGGPLVLVVDSATLSDAEADTEEQTTKFGRRGGMGLRWAPKKALRGPMTGLGSTARDERFMATAQTRTKRSKGKWENKRTKKRAWGEKARAFERVGGRWEVIRSPAGDVIWKDYALGARWDSELGQESGQWASGKVCRLNLDNSIVVFGVLV